MTMIGQRVGNYVIKQQLGEGGMGEVFLAEHPQIGKRVALKVLHQELASNQDITTRFFHEAKAVNDIGHPNIVDILDFGTAPTDRGNVVYLVMELLTGSTLTSAIEQSPLDAARTTRIALQVADALAASHAKGIVHRDLKPDNIMLVPRGRDEHVKLLDFGIAKVANTGASTKTRTGMVMGTPTYMSPEQCEGRGNIDHRTDIYALGIVLYEMLTGRVPFQGSGYGEILVKQMTEAPLPPSAVRPGIPPHLEQVVLKSLQKRPDDRFASMHELANALAQPEHYVNAHGGLGGFLPVPAISAATPSAATVMVPAAAPFQPNPTTLSQSAGQLTPVPAAMASAAMVAATPVTAFTRGRSKAPMVAIAGVVAAAIAGVITVVSLRGGDKRDTTAAAAPAAEPALATKAPEAPATNTAPATEPAPPPAPAPTPPPPDPAPIPAPKAEPAKVKLTIASKPAGASVFVADEPTPRCKTPCDVDEPRGDVPATITVKLSGYADVKRTLPLSADQRVAVELRKAASRTVTKKPAKNTTAQPIGDNTLNPFED